MFIPAERADCKGDVHSRSRSSGTSELARGEIHISPWGEVYISSPSPEHLSAQGRASTLQVYELKKIAHITIPKNKNIERLLIIHKEVACFRTYMRWSLIKPKGAISYSSRPCHTKVNSLEN
jgi:hypothetical protein